MPFRRAPYWIAALIALTVLGFWPSYFAVMRTAPWGFHFHGLTASLWLLLLMAQSATASARRFDLHRLAGRASLGLYPFFLAGTGAVVHSMATATAAGDPFYTSYGARLAMMDLPSALLLGWLYYHALATRRSVQLHARYMLATPLPLMVPALGRVVTNYVPGLMIGGPAELWKFAWGVRIANGIAIAAAWWLYRTAPRHGRAFAVTGAVLLIEAALFETLGHAAAWNTVYRALAAMPLAPLLTAIVLAGMAIGWFGWQAARPARRAVAAVSTS